MDYRYAVQSQGIKIDVKSAVKTHIYDMCIILLSICLIFLSYTAVTKIVEERLVGEEIKHIATKFQKINFEINTINEDINKSKANIGVKASKDLGMIRRNEEQAIKIQSKNVSVSKALPEEMGHNYETFDIIEALKSVIR